MAPQAEKVALCAAIRRDSKAGMSGRALEHKYGVSRRTVAKALASVAQDAQEASAAQDASGSL